MKEYDVVWSESAQKDLERIVEYIKLDSVERAKRIFEEIRKECRELHFFPERKRVVPELQLIGLTKYRELIYKRWRIVFKMERNEVHVLLVADSSQNMEELLFQRFVWL